MKHWIILLFLALSVTGCAGTDSIQSRTWNSNFEVQGKTYDEIWDATRKSVRRLAQTSGDKAAGILRAEKRSGRASEGEAVVVTITPAENGADVYSISVQNILSQAVSGRGQDLASRTAASIQSELGQ
jgi:hypothetical protein